MSQVVRIARSASSPQAAADLLTKSAFVAGSLDNLTAVVVALRGYVPKSKGISAHSVAEMPSAEIGASCHVAASAGDLLPWRPHGRRRVGSDLWHWHAPWLDIAGH